MVYDQDFDAPLGLAEVTVAETGETVQATEEGNYVISGLAAGTYTVVIAKDGYIRKVFADVVVPAGSMIDQDAYLSGEFTDMEEFIVQDLSLGGSSEEGLLKLRMEAPALMDSVGADLMSQGGASDAADALKLVAGATVQDGKYAVVRGLPDRYVNSQMNGVRLPTADPDKRAVQLDQFPTAIIESIQVSKTFTPDQQGDASGGAVNVVLKGIPEEPVFKFKVGTGANTQLHDNDDKLLSYEGGELGMWGENESEPQLDSLGDNWDGDVGASEISAPFPYNWEATAGGDVQLNEDVSVGGLVNVYYSRSASHVDDAVNDKYWIESAANPLLTPTYSGQATGSPDDEFKTSLFDVSKSTQELQWGGLGAVGVDAWGQSLKLVYMRTHVTEASTTVAEDTRGKEYFVTADGYDPEAMIPGGGGGGYRDAAPWLRNQTLSYTERDTETLQFSGTHTLPMSEFGWDGVFKILPLEGDWTIAKSSSSLESEKRMFGSMWLPGVSEYTTGGRRPVTIPGIPSGYYPLKPGANINLGSLQWIWKSVTEESDQYFANVKLPFEQWSGEQGYVKSGVFNDQVSRSYTQDAFGNFGDGLTNPEAEWLTWDSYWSDVFWDGDHAMSASSYDVDYTAEQQITAWYYMVDLPLTSFFKVTGGVRREQTSLSIVLDPDDSVLWVPPGTDIVTDLNPGDGDVSFEGAEDLPSMAFELKPVDMITIRGAYSETVARQTFKELTPIQQSEYLGSDIFIGNPELQMSRLKNYDLRLDIEPMAGSLISASWFKKDLVDPIEYVQDSAGDIGVYTTARNYPSGTMDGFEFEVRQQLGFLWDSLEGVSVGGNATLLKSEVTLPDDEAARLAGFGMSEPERDMLNAPEHLYNLFATYDIEKTGTKLGIFYSVKGDTLVSGASYREFYTPDVYTKEYATLNFSLSQKLGEHWTLAFKAKNLLNPPIQEVYRSDYVERDAIKTSYRKGLSFSFSLGCEF